MSEPEPSLNPAADHESTGQSESASSSLPASTSDQTVNATDAIPSTPNEPPLIPTQPAYEAPTYAAPTYGAPPPAAAPAAPGPRRAGAAPAAPAPVAPAPAAPQAPAVWTPTAPAAEPTVYQPPAPQLGTPAAPQYGAPATAAPQYGAPAPVVPQSAVPASGMPASGLPASAVPASGQPVGYTQPTYAPGYAPPGYPAQPAYGAPVPPTVQVPMGVAPTPPAKRGKTGIIVLSILTALFVLATAGMSVMFIGAKSDLNKEKKTVASQQSQIDGLNKTNSDTASQLSTLKSSTDDQIRQLKSDKGAMSKCIDDVDKLINLPQSASNATVNKDYDKMVTDCAVAKALAD